MIALRRIDHVCLRVTDLDEAIGRWSLQFGLSERLRDDDRALLACAHEPYSLELRSDREPGPDHTGFMEQLPADHEPRVWPDDPHSSNVWGIVPPHSFFGFDAAAVEAERLALEAQGHPLPPEGD